MPLLVLLLIALLPRAAFAAADSATRPVATSQSTLQARPTPRDPLKDLPSYGDTLRRTAWTLFAIVAALILVAKFLPRWLNPSRWPPRGGAGKLIEVVESHRLEPRKAIHLIRVAGQYFLVGSAGDRLETLAGGPLDQQQVAAALRPGAATKPARAAEPEPAIKRQFEQVLRGKREE